MNAADTASLNRLAASATAHCLTGCAIGEVLGLAIGTALGWGDLATIGITRGRGHAVVHAHHHHGREAAAREEIHHAGHDATR